MAAKPADRRIEKTRKALKEALVYLIQEKSFESVSIQEILDKADVGRSTFYIHYESKYELLHDCFHDFSRLLEASDKAEPKSGDHDFLLGLFEIIEQNRPLAKTVLGKGGTPMLQRPIEDYIHIQIKQSLEKSFLNRKRPAIPIDLVVHCLACALIGTLRWWLYSGTHSSAEEVNRYFKRIAFGGVKDALGSDLFHVL